MTPQHYYIPMRKYISIDDIQMEIYKVSDWFERLEKFGVWDVICI